MRAPRFHQSQGKSTVVKSGDRLPFLLLLIPLLIGGYFLPVFFHLHFAYGEEGVSLRLGLDFLHGLFHREHDFLAPADLSGTARGKRTADAPLAKSKEAKADEVTPERLLDRAQEAGERFRLYGLAGTFLSYFIPQKCLPWLRVAERLENRGRFTKLHWRTTIGLDEAAATAWAIGLLWFLKSWLLNLLDQRYGLPRTVARVGVEPSFGAPGLRTALDCIFRLRVGHIIRAGLRGFLLDKLRKDVPLG